ncbi:hypothetical protein NC652_027446 [Populus alba x Populus x berolinensis]|nr:hypothetical protein NC652_027446 [Populus alba x Populus x berolinensis]
MPRTHKKVTERKAGDLRYVLNLFPPFDSLCARRESPFKKRFIIYERAQGIAWKLQALACLFGFGVDVHVKLTDDAGRLSNWSSKFEKKLLHGFWLNDDNDVDLIHQNFKGAGAAESTRAIYERIVDLRMATPQIIINYAWLLQVWTSIIALMQLIYM